MKYQVDALPSNVHRNNLQTTSSYWTFIRWINNIKLLIWSLGKAFFSGSHFGRNFSRLLGKSWKSPGMATASWVNQGWLCAMFWGKLGWELCGLGSQESWEDGVLGGVSGGSSAPPLSNVFDELSMGLLGI